MVDYIALDFYSSLRGSQKTSSRTRFCRELNDINQSFCQRLTWATLIWKTKWHRFFSLDIYNDLETWCFPWNNLWIPFHSNSHIKYYSPILIIITLELIDNVRQPTYELSRRDSKRTNEYLYNNVLLLYTFRDLKRLDNVYSDIYRTRKNLEKVPYFAPVVIVGHDGLH